MRSSGRDWLAPSAGVEMYWDVLGIVETPLCVLDALAGDVLLWGGGSVTHGRLR